MRINRDWLTRFRGDMTHQEVADAAGIDRSFYTQIESGIRNPGVDTAKSIARVLRFDWTIFFEDPGGVTQLDDQALDPTGTEEG